MKLGKFSIAGLAALFMAVIAPFHAAASDRYIGYYYPAPAETENYCARIPPLPDMDKRKRIGFVIGLKDGASSVPFEVPYYVFAKGGEARKLIIISKRDGYLNSIYRVRALLAEMTANARTMPFFEETGAPEELTFLDLLAALEFSSITVSDGIAFTHQIALLPATSACRGVAANEE